MPRLSLVRCSTLLHEKASSCLCLGLIKWRWVATSAREAGISRATFLLAAAMGAVVAYIAMSIMCMLIAFKASSERGMQKCHLLLALNLGCRLGGQGVQTHSSDTEVSKCVRRSRQGRTGLCVTSRSSSKPSGHEELIKTRRTHSALLLVSDLRSVVVVVVDAIASHSSLFAHPFRWVPLSARFVPCPIHKL